MGKKVSSSKSLRTDSPALPLVHVFEDGETLSNSSQCLPTDPVPYLSGMFVALKNLFTSSFDQKVLLFGNHKAVPQRSANVKMMLFIICC